MAYFSYGLVRATSAGCSQTLLGQLHRQAICHADLVRVDRGACECADEGRQEQDVQRLIQERHDCVQQLRIQGQVHEVLGFSCRLPLQAILLIPAQARLPLRILHHRATGRNSNESCRSLVTAAGRAACHHLHTCMSKPTLTSEDRAGGIKCWAHRSSARSSGRSALYAVHSSPQKVKPATEAPQLKCSENTQPIKSF